MNTKRVLILSITVLLAVAAIIFIIGIIRNNSPGEELTSDEGTYALPTGTAQSELLRIPTKGGGELEVKNFYLNPDSTEEGLVFLKKTDSYEIVYDPGVNEENVFSIVVYGSLTSPVRFEAEEMLLSLLAITQTNACLLDVRVYPTIRFQPDKKRAQDLSFCN